MVPTIRDVRGVPVPGLAAAPRPVARRADFSAVLAALRPSPGPRRRAPLHLPGVRPRLGAAAPAPGAAARSAAAKHALAAAIRSAAEHAGVEPALSVAVARAESNLDPRARSRDGLSVGTFQVTYYTAAEMRRKIARGTVARPPGGDDVALGVGYLRYLHDLFGRRAQLGHGLETIAVGDADERRQFAVAAFNAGEGRVARAQARTRAAGGDPTRFADVRPFLPPITQRYVERVAAYARAEAPARATARA
jgi:soluble lytic murein transglycosylase-like protein